MRTTQSDYLYYPCILKLPGTKFLVGRKFLFYSSVPV